MALGALERQLLAVALCDLNRSGFIDITVDEDRARKVTSMGHPLLSSRFVLRFTRAAASPPGGLLETRLFDLLDANPTDLYELLVLRWVGNGSLPLNGVIVLTQREALSAGLLIPLRDAQTRVRSLQWSESVTNLEADLSTMAVVEHAFSDVALRLGSFAATSGLVWRRLLKECGQALYEARPSPVDVGGGG